MSPRLPVVLVEGVLDRDDGVLLDVAEVEVRELDTRDPLRGVRVGVLEVEVVLAVLVELGRGHVERDLDLALVAGLLDGLREELKRLVGARDVRGEATLVTNVDSCKKYQLLQPRGSTHVRTIDAVLGADDLLEGVVSLGTNLHGLREASGASGEEHELLERELVAGVGATVDDVEAGSGEDEGGLDTGEVSEVLVEGNALLGGGSLRDGDGNTEDGVSTELALVGGTVELDQEVVDLLLLGDLETGLDELGRDRVVDVGDGLEDACRDDQFAIRLFDARSKEIAARTLADVVGLVAITELDSFVNTSGSTRGDSSTEAT